MKSEIPEKLHDRAKKGLCPICNKQRKKHTKEMLEHCRRTFNKKVYGKMGIDDMTILRQTKRKLKQ